MPSVHIPEASYSVLADEYGYQGAKTKVKELAREHAEEVSNDD